MFKLSEDRARFIDSMCKVITLAGFVAGGWWTLYKYFDGRDVAARTAAIEAKKPFEAERLNLYLRASSAAASLAASREKKERDKAEQEFWTLYWGPLSIVEDKAVEANMVRLGRCIRDKECEKPIEQLALDLDYACRMSVAESWDVYLPADVVTFGRLERMRDQPMQDQKR